MSEILFKESQFTWKISVYAGYVCSIVFFLLLLIGGSFLYGLIVGVIIAIGVYLWKLSRDKTTYSLTNESVIIETGLLNKTIRKVPLSKIQDVTLKQDILQKQFNVGNLFIESAGESGGSLPIKDILDPHNKMEQILKTAHKR